MRWFLQFILIKGIKASTFMVKPIEYHFYQKNKINEVFRWNFIVQNKFKVN